MSLEENFINSLYQCGELFGRRSIADFINFTKDSGLSMPQINVLIHLYYLDSCEMAKVKAFIPGNFAAASQIVDRLVERGLVERFSDSEDRRIRKIRLTGQGKDLVWASFNDKLQWIRDIAGRFSAAEQDQILNSLNILIGKTKEA